MVIDVERLGDYTKNILDMAIHYPEALVSEELLPDLNVLENEVMSRFQKTCESVGRQDLVLAEKLLKTPFCCHDVPTGVSCCQCVPEKFLK